MILLLFYRLFIVISTASCNTTYCRIYLKNVRDMYLFQCSETCGTGTQTRKVYCSLGIDRENACDHSTKPEASRACLSDKDCSGLWFTGPWSQVIF